jgi:prevent-host-death family protein
MAWSAQEARRSFSEVLRRAHDEGEQIVTKHGREVAVVLDIDDYRRLRQPARAFTQHLLSIPTFDDDWAAEFDAEVARDRHQEPAVLLLGGAGTVAWSADGDLDGEGAHLFAAPPSGIDDISGARAYRDDG